jgi:DNA gyrase/topoisomerase IV subunit B
MTVINAGGKFGGGRLHGVGASVVNTLVLKFFKEDDS